MKYTETPSISSVIRPLGQIEQAMFLTHSLAHGGTQSIIVAHLDGKVRFDDLYDTAKSVFEEYRLLRCFITKDEMSRYVFCEHGDWNRIAITHHALTKAISWNELECLELHEPLDASIALWRLSLYSNDIDSLHKMVLVFHHAISDADGARIVLGKLLRGCAHQSTEALSLQFGVPNAVESYLPTPQATNEHITPSIQIPASIRHAASVSFSERRTCTLHEMLDGELLNQLKGRCAADRVNFDSIVAAALVQSSQQVLSLTSPLRIKTAISLRPFAKMKGASSDGLGCYIGVADILISSNENSLLTIAKNYQTQLLVQTSGKLMKQWPNDPEKLKHGIEGIRDSVSLSFVGITNVGALVEQPDFGRFVVSEVYNLTNRCLGGAVVVLHLSSSLGQARMVYHYVAPLVSTDTAIAIQAQVRRTLTQYCEGED